MKKIFPILIIVLITTGFISNSDKVDLKTFAEEAMNKSKIGANPTIVITEYSAKIYSKIDLKHSVFRNLKREGLFIINKNSDLLEELYGEETKRNGAIVYMNAHNPKPNLKQLRIVLNGKEIPKSVSDTLKLNNIQGFVCLKKRDTEKYIGYINTLD